MFFAKSQYNIKNDEQEMRDETARGTIRKTFVLTTFHIQRVCMRRMHITLFDFVETSKDCEHKHQQQQDVFLSFGLVLVELCVCVWGARIMAMHNAQTPSKHIFGADHVVQFSKTQIRSKKNLFLMLEHASYLYYVFHITRMPFTLLTQGHIDV